jgi:hypothetical protein
MRASYFDTSLMVNPRPVCRDRKPLVVRAIVVFAIVVVGALVFGFLRPSPGTPNTASNTPTTKSVPASPSLHADAADPVARGRLLSRLPPGYPSGTCEPVAPPEDALAKLSCERTPAWVARCRRRTRWCATKPGWVGLSTPSLAPPRSELPRQMSSRPAHSAATRPTRDQRHAHLRLPARRADGRMDHRCRPVGQLRSRRSARPQPRRALRVVVNPLLTR